MIMKIRMMMKIRMKKRIQKKQKDCSKRKIIKSLLNEEFLFFLKKILIFLYQRKRRKI